MDRAIADFPAPAGAVQPENPMRGNGGVNDPVDNLLKNGLACVWVAFWRVETIC